ncbi:MAG TPA: hypothetical protein VGL94_02250 [Ktedonobacteraceae bacterium]|jgi:dsDNA-binding SOS-regulon protein
MTFSDEFPGGAEQRIWRSALGINPLRLSINNKQLYDRLDNILLTSLREHEMLWQCFVIAEPLCTTEQKENLQLSFADIRQSLQQVLNNRRTGPDRMENNDEASEIFEELYQTSQKLSEIREEIELFSI